MILSRFCTSRLTAQRQLEAAAVQLRRVALFHSTPQPFLRSSHIRQAATPEIKESIFAPLRINNPPNLTDVRYVHRAILRGDKLDPRSSIEPPPAQRRALIVAPFYLNLRVNNDHMPETMCDARKIHQSLLKQGYQAKDIRILSEGFHDQFNGYSDPTRANILTSLDWLVDGANSTDHRFFHFSGHGERFISKKGEGKRTRVALKNVNTMTVEAESDDTERYIREEPPLRVEAQTTPQSQLTYYKEAIRVLPRYNAETRDEQEWIEDWELNTIFSQLPEGCTLTSVLDCCASGRMINNTIKAGGYGFRGGSNEPTKRSMSSVPAAAEGSLVEISMPEKLPEVEAAMDRITANAYTWAACHQRQQAAAHPHSTGSGHFTWVFTQELDLAPREMSIEELFNKVSERMQREALPGNNQYAQLRVSMAERTHWQVKLRDMMERPVSVI